MRWNCEITLPSLLALLSKPGFCFDVDFQFNILPTMPDLAQVPAVADPTDIL